MGIHEIPLPLKKHSVLDTLEVVLIVTQDPVILGPRHRIGLSPNDLSSLAVVIIGLYIEITVSPAELAWLPEAVFAKKADMEKH